MTTDIQTKRQGLLRFIEKKGGSISMRDLHTHSLLFYQAGHQAFSELMEGLVADHYVTVENDNVEPPFLKEFQLTETGRTHLNSAKEEPTD